MTLADLYANFDPLHPLGADESDLYVDWLNELQMDDVKVRLVQAIQLSRDRSAGVLFSGHRGTGKTTELRRVAQQLEAGVGGRRHLVAHVEVENINDPSLTCDEIVLQIAIGVARRLRDEGYEEPFNETGNWLRRLLGRVKDQVSLDEARIETTVPVIDIVKITMTLSETSSTRSVLRAALKSERQSLTELVNDYILAPATRWLQERNMANVVVIVDQLDRLPRSVGNGGLTNYEHLFIGESGPLRNLTCDTVFVVPVELTYSTSLPRLVNTWGSEVVTLPLPPVQSRNATDRTAAIACLRSIVDRRIEAANHHTSDLFAEADLARLIAMSGGHHRTLFILMNGLLLRSKDVHRFTSEEIDLVLRATARDMIKALGPHHWPLLDKVGADNRRHDTPDHADMWFDLLQNFFVLAYEDGGGEWYDTHPLLGLARPQ